MTTGTHDASAIPPLGVRERYYAALFAGFVQHADEYVFILEKDASIRFCSQNVSAALAKTAGPLVGKDFFSVFGGVHASAQKKAFQKNIASKQKKFDLMLFLHTSDKQLKLHAMFSNYLANPDVGAVLMTMSDITKQQNINERIEFYEHFDPLTRLPNRESFLRYTENMIAMSKNVRKLFCVMAVGLDHFKRVNDIYGTTVGDKVLAEIAGTLSASIGNGAVVSRYMGDQFFILFPDIAPQTVSSQVTASQDSIQNLVARVRSLIATPLVLSDALNILLSASMGLAFFPNDGLSAEELFRNAETALYMAKDSGRDIHKLFDSKLNKELMEQQQLETDITIAIGKRMFEPYFQAKVDRSGHIVGAEALARWRLENGKVKQPETFIALAEQSGVIDKIGAMIILKTCEFVAAWTAQGLLDIPISINLSPRQFSQEFLVEDIAAIVDISGLDPRRFEFEITEASIMQNERENLYKLFKLKDLGVSISIDDFGTGYSSFSKLKDYPIDTVKLDKSFIDPLPLDRKASMVVSGIIELAHTLGFSVVAEGVERTEQLAFLDSVFCDQFQGYLFSEPLEEKEFKRMLTRPQSLLPQSCGGNDLEQSGIAWAL